MSRIACLFALWCIAGLNANAALVLYNFSDNTGAPIVSSPITGVTFGSMGMQNSRLTIIDPINSTSSSSGYVGASGTDNFSTIVKQGPLDVSAAGSSYFNVQITNSSGNALVLNSISLGARSTDTGASLIELRYSNSPTPFGTSLQSFFLDNVNNPWQLHSATFSTPVLLGSNTTMELRLYAHGTMLTSSTPNTRIDDVQFDITAVPEPTSLLFGIGLSGIACVYLARRKRCRSKHF